MDSSKFKEMAVSSLSFDRINPRLIEFDITPKSTDEEIINILWDNMDVYELVLSLAASGYFPHEPLIVASEKKQNVVIEGNRRLAAVRVLLEPGIIKNSELKIPQLTSAAKKKLESVPVLLSSREEAWRYLGFKHVNGPAKWTSYAKSNYIADIHRKYKVPLENIASQIGDTHKTVQRLYRGLMVVEQAEREKVFNRDDRFNKHFSFSHIYTSLDYDGISEYLDLKSASEETESPVPKKNISKLGDLLLWMYGSKKEKIEPKVRSQNPHLRQLNAIVQNREAIAYLKQGGDIEQAYEITRPSTTVFEEALFIAKSSLQRAYSHVSQGYDGSEDLLKTAGTIAEMADDLYRQMHNKFKPSKQTRITE